MEGSYRKGLLLLHVLLVSALCTAQSGDFSSDINTQTTYVCEYSILELFCPAHHVIRITHAAYGRFTRWSCNPHGVIYDMNKPCSAPNAVQVISSKCDGHITCVMFINNQTFNDPCPGISKYVTTKHYCEPGI